MCSPSRSGNDMSFARSADSRTLCTRLKGHSWLRDRKVAEQIRYESTIVASHFDHTLGSIIYIHAEERGLRTIFQNDVHVIDKK